MDTEYTGDVLYEGIVYKTNKSSRKFLREKMAYVFHKKTGLIIADGATGSLDEVNENKTLEFLLKLNKEGTL